MPEASPLEISVPRLSATQRLVALASLPLFDARNGSVPGVTTALRLGWRDDKLLIRFDCRHRGIVATLREDNADLWTEDVVEAFLSFEDPPLRYLELEVNPLGARFSAVVDSPNLSRDEMTVRKIPFPDFQAEVNVRERRWSAKLSIPLAGPVAALGPLFRSLRAEDFATTPRRERQKGSRAAPPVRPEGVIFRGNFFRVDRTSGEFSALFPTLADPPDFHVPGSFGRFRLGP